MEFYAAAVLVGLGFGILLQKGRFCFVSAFRDFIAYKDTRVLKGVISGILSMMVLVSILYFLGIQAENFWVPPFGLSSLIGGFVFGVGMTLAGGCASGTLYRAGQGYLHFWIVLVFTALGYIIFAEAFDPVFLPYYFLPLQVFRGVSAFLEAPRYLAPVIAVSIAAFFASSLALLSRRTFMLSIPFSARSKLNSPPRKAPVGSALLLSVLKKPWSTTLCGMGIGALAAVWLAIWQTWSITGPEARWVGLFLGSIAGWSYVSSHPYWGGVIFGRYGIAITPDMVMLAALVIGSFTSSLLSGDFRIRKPVKKGVPNATAGGLLMGFGARMAPGCNISNTFSGLAILSLSGAVVTLGLILGVYITTHWIYRKVGCAI